MWHLSLFAATFITASEYPKMSKQGTAGKRKHVTLIIPQKLVLIRSL